MYMYIMICNIDYAYQMEEVGIHKSISMFALPAGMVKLMSESTGVELSWSHVKLPSVICKTRNTDMY